MKMQGGNVTTVQTVCTAVTSVRKKVKFNNKLRKKNNKI